MEKEDKGLKFVNWVFSGLNNTHSVSDTIFLGITSKYEFVVDLY